MISEFKIPTDGHIYSKERLKKAVEEYNKMKDKGLVRLTHGERTGCIDLDFRSLYTGIKDADISKQVLDALKSEQWNNHSKDNGIGNQMRIE